MESTRVSQPPWGQGIPAGRGAGIGRTYYGFAKNVLTAAKQNGATRIV
jgi:hypothetical protein